MFVKSHEDVQKTYDAIGRIKRLSDRIIGIGPINIIGLDGLLALIPIPVVGTVYSVGAGLIILSQGLKARVSPGTWFTALLILMIDSGITTIEDVTKIIPFAGPVLNLATGGIDALFQGHLYAAHIIQKDIDKTHYVDGSASEARKSGAHKAHQATVKATKGKSRIVYFHS